jgi:hypothetical protein
MSAFVLLGIGALGRRFRGREFPLPNGGRMTWIRWRDEDWGDDNWPVLHGYARGDEIVPASVPEEGSEEYLDNSADAGRFVFQIDDPQPFGDEEEAAAAYADAFAGLLSVPAPMGYEPEVIELDPAWVDAGEATLQEVARLDRRPSYGGPHPTLRQTWMFEEELVERLCELMLPSLTDGDAITWGALPALIYYRLSVYDLAFTPDDRAFLCGEDREQQPQTPYEAARLEQAFHNAFKSMEALINGEFPGDVVRIEKRLSERGIDAVRDPIQPDGDGLSMAERVDAALRLRDVASAHGGALGSAASGCTSTT